MLVSMCAFSSMLHCSSEQRTLPANLPRSVTHQSLSVQFLTWSSSVGKQSAGAGFARTNEI